MAGTTDGLIFDSDPARAAAEAAAGGAVTVNGFAEWRAAARALIVRHRLPESVQWRSRGSDAELADLFGDVSCDAPLPSSAPADPARAEAAASGQPPAALRLPRKLMELLQYAACFRDPARWSFLYKIVWRWQHGQHDVMTMADADGARLHHMAKAVRREEHDMHAYLRFRERPADADGPRFIAWFEPAHEVLPQVARHFADRMGRTTWMIATPDATVLWDGASLHATGPLLRGAADIDDAGEALWLTYYRSIFNPARLNPDVMHGHVRMRFWKHMPEAALVPSMVSSAAAGERRTGQAQAVGRRSGTTIPIAPEKAQPARQQPHTLDECRRCELWEHATQAVPGEGAAHARIMLVGEQPGDQEDLAGHPFVGPAGALLDRAMAEAGVDRKTVYVTNAVKHFKWEPRGKRRLHKTPGQREVMACHYWLEGELEKVAPKVVVALGSTALKSVLEDGKATLKDFIGAPVRHKDYRVVATYHPAYILRAPSDEEKARAYAALVTALRTALDLDND